LGESVLVLAAFRVPFFLNGIEGAFPKQMVVFMAFSASEQNVFVFNGLGPVFVLIFQYDGSWERLSDVQVYTDSRIGGITPLLGCFRRFDIDTNGVAYASQDLL